MTTGATNIHEGGKPYRVVGDKIGQPLVVKSEQYIDWQRTIDELLAMGYLFGEEVGRRLFLVGYRGPMELVVMEGKVAATRGVSVDDCALYLEGL